MSKPELIVAIDVPNIDAAKPALDELQGLVPWVKIGLELFIAEGPNALRPALDRGYQVFLDLKLHDIPNTVASAVSSAAELGAGLLTLHASGGRSMMRAAADAASKAAQPPKLLAVTTLTSMDQSDFDDLAIQRTIGDQALALCGMALDSGIDGVVSSVLEAPALRERFGGDPLLVTPGIRPADADVGDQKRVATPADAVAAGASFLVVGRPIMQAPDRRAAAEAITEQIRAASA